MKTIDNILNKGKLGLVGLLTLGSLGLGSCAAVYEDPIAGGAIGILPKWVQPGGYRDLKEGEIKEKEEWYIDRDMIVGNIEDRIKCVYSVIVQDINTKNLEEERVSAMMGIDCSNCPDDFKEAYSNHIQAWKIGDYKEINKTWNKVVHIALKYGVRKK